MIYKIAVLASTRGTVLQAIMGELEAGEMPGIELVGVLSDKNCGAIDRAAEQGLPNFTFDAKGKTREEFDSELLLKLEELEADLIVMVGYMRIVSKLFIDKYRGRILNVHPSLLPAFPGGVDGDVHEAVLAAGVEKTGCTIHLVDENLDAGEILMQMECSVDSDETTESLKAKVQDLECKAMPEIIRQFADGRLKEGIE
ncbi:MAG: formyltetrahydrofolate-dependent phosphoribosylglycinamide formyltransferase [Oceanicoccus sp.]|jgi:formyltetrahydrofolate-dependent phosphoribosylglycinamide formyltransferase